MYIGSIIAAVVGGVLFFWLQQLFKKFEHGATPTLIFQFCFALGLLAIMAFLIPVIIGAK